MEPDKITAAAAAEAVTKRESSARELTEAFLSRCSAINGKLNSFIHICEEEALSQAGAVDDRVRRGEKLPLAGVPVALKDNLCYRNAPTTCGAAALKDFRPPYNAFAVQKLVDAGAVIVGKTNLDQFGLGLSTLSSFAGPTANPWNADSSPVDGAAAAVSAGQCLLALGSDTGGSLRIASSRCGLFGLRPTNGRVSRHGLISFAPSFAQVGIMARDAADANLALKAIAGYDPRDPATAVVKDGLPGADGKVSPEGLKIGLPPAVFELAEDKSRAALTEVRVRLESAGAVFVDISLPLFAEALQAYCVIAAAEASSNLSRFDGIRYGVPEEGANLDQWYGKTRGSTFGAEGKRRSVLGAYLLSGDSFEKYYRQALKVWNLVRRGFDDALKNCDLLALPAAGPAKKEAAGSRDFLEEYRQDLFCAPVSLSGLPAFTIPAGETDGAPLGLQLVGKPFGEAALAALAARAAVPFKLSPAGVL